MRENVTMECGHSPAPGMDWNVTVSFVGNAKMYRVWSRSDEDQNRVLLKQAAGPLTWRRMVADIKELDEIGLGGDLLRDIQVSGLTDWQASLLKMAWCKFEGPAERQLELLLDLPDETIALLEEKLGDLTDPDVLAALDEVIEAKEELQISIAQVDQAINETAKTRRKGLDPWVQSISEWFRAHEVINSGPGVSMEVGQTKYMTSANEKTLRDLGERFVVAEITRDLQPDGLLLDGIGHDASFFDLPRLPDEVLVINTDRSGMNIAYRMGLAGPECVGDFGVSHAVSDIVVAGGAPCAITVALLLPSDTTLDFVRGVMRGATQAARRYGASIVGGDTKQNPKFAMVVTAIGTAHRDRRVLRSGAQPGDMLVVTGHLGAMVLGLVAFDREIPLSDEARRVVETALVEQRPPFELGRAVGPAGIASAGTDISDGLPGAVHALCSASGVGALIDERRLPMHPALSSVISAAGLSPLQISSAGGDWQYLYALAPSQIEDLGRMAVSIGATVSVVGSVVESGLMAVRTLDGEWRKLNRVEHDSFADRDGAGHFSKIGHLAAVAGDLVDQTQCSHLWPLGD